MGPHPRVLGPLVGNGRYCGARMSRLLVLAYVAFISIGLPDTVLGVAWPSVRAAFGVSQSALGAILAAWVTGYCLSGVLAGVAERKLGVGGLLTLSSVVIAVGLTGYSLAASWFAFFPIGFVMGLGSGAIDSGLNGYAARHFSARHLNWLHACWGIGASAGPVIMTACIARGLGYRAGYATIACVLGAVAIGFLSTQKAWSEPRTVTPPAISTSMAVPGDFGAALRSGGVWLQMATFFVYTSLEATVGQWCFTLMRDARGVSVEAAGAWTAAYWASLTLGRFALGYAVEHFGADRLLRAASVAIVAGAAAFALDGGAFGRVGLLLLGFGLAPVFPTLMSRTPARLGEALSRHAIGFQVSAGILGAALLPALVGVLVAARGAAAIGAVTLGLGVAFPLVHEILLRRSNAA
jgi:fucose permease